jgi:protein-disulfide isomerase
MSDEIDDPEQEQHPEQMQARQHGAEGEPRIELESEAVRARLRSRLGRLALVVAVVAVVLAVVALTAGGQGSPPKPGSGQASATEQKVSALLAGIPQSANTLGQPAAPVTLEWYGDLECPYCREFTLGALPSLIQRWVRDGQLKIEYLSMETATREPKVFQTQQVAALAAGMQNKMWNFIETFYHEQGEEDSGYVTERYLQGLASQVPGLNMALWREDRFDPALAAQVRVERNAAIRARFRGTPTFLIGRSDGRLYPLESHSLVKPRFYNKVIELLLRV